MKVPMITMSSLSGFKAEAGFNTISEKVVTRTTGSQSLREDKMIVTT